MTCFYHSEQEPSAQCMDCGKYLCAECASKNVPCLCPDCSKTRSIDSTFGEALRIFLKSSLFFVLSAAFVYFVMLSKYESRASEIEMILILALPFSGIPWGWSFLSRMIPLRASGSIIWVGGFYLIKLVLAYFIGLVVMLFNVLKIIYLLIKGIVQSKKST